MKATRARRLNSKRRAQRRPKLDAVERLEARELLTFTPLGFSLPDLTIANALAGPVAAYGGALTVTVDVANIGAASLPEPFAQFPGAMGQADAPPSKLGVFAAPNFRTPLRNQVFLGTIDVPAIAQNSLVRVTEALAMPAERPARFPAIGQNVFLTFIADYENEVNDLDRTNNVFRGPVTTQIQPAFVDVQAIAMNVALPLQPGDAIVPEIKLANFGTVPTSTQGILIVDLVASTDEFFSPDDEILATFTILDIPPLSAAPTGPTSQPTLGDINLTDPPNVVTITTPEPILLPESPSSFFIGLAVDPFGIFDPINDPDPVLRLQQIRPVGPPIPDLPPSTVVRPPTLNPFPFPPFLPTELAEPPADPPEPLTTTTAVVRPAANRPLAQWAEARAASRPIPPRLRVDLPLPRPFWGRFSS